MADRPTLIAALTAESLGLRWHSGDRRRMSRIPGKIRAAPPALAGVHDVNLTLDFQGF